MGRLTQIIPVDPLQSQGILIIESQDCESQKRRLDGSGGQSGLRKGPGINECRQPLVAGKASKQNLHQRLLKEYDPVDPFKTPDLQNSNIMNVCFFKSLNL